MGRNLALSAIVLKNHRIGEIHKGVMLFTDASGIVSAIAHGAYSQKGKLRGVTNPFCAGTVYLYHDPVKDSYKVTDFDVLRFYDGLRDDVTRYFTANLWAEVILKSHGGGVSSPELFSLLCDALAELDLADGDHIRRISAAYLFRFLAQTGALPESDAPADAEFGPEYVAEPRQGQDPIVLPESFRLLPAARRYLRETEALPLGVAARTELDEASLKSLLSYLYRLVGDLVEAPLNTLEVGGKLLL